MSGRDHILGEVIRRLPAERRPTIALSTGIQAAIDHPWPTEPEEERKVRDLLAILLEAPDASSAVRVLNAECHMSTMTLYATRTLQGQQAEEAFQRQWHELEDALSRADRKVSVKFADALRA
jgi:hypothetical protein